MAGTEYPKIETLYDRDPETFAVDTTKFRCPEFALVNSWLLTEKIDGTNIRVEWSLAEGDGDAYVALKGRTDDAQMPPTLVDTLRSLNFPHTIGLAFDRPSTGILYGEGYGPKIQKGGIYRTDGPSFRLFDVQVGNWWLNWSNVEDVARKLGIRTVPVLGRGVKTEGTAGADDLIAWGTSQVAAEEGGDSSHLPEGIVARTDPLLFNRKGERVMWKLKYKDFRGKGSRS